MIPFKLDLGKANEELREFQRQLADGIGALSEVGRVHPGCSEKDAVYAEDMVTLYRFRPLTKKPNGIPLLIVYALVNRPDMVDLQEDRSLVRGLLRAGYDLFLIDWGYPKAADCYLTMDDYINGYLDTCVEKVKSVTGYPAVNLLGVCQGGTFSLCYAATHPRSVKNLITMVTPVDFHTEDNLLSLWARHVDIDALVDAHGNIPGEYLNQIFLALKPYMLGPKKYHDLVSMLGDRDKLENFLRMEQWIADSPDQAGETFRQFIKDLFQQNLLIKGDLRIGNHQVQLDRLSMPILNIYATQDHLVPPAASKALAHHVDSGDYSELAFDGGHIGIYVSSKAQNQIPSAIDSWLLARNR